MGSEKAMEAARLGVRGGGAAAGESIEEKEEREEGGEDMLFLGGGCSEGVVEGGCRDVAGVVVELRAGARRLEGSDVNNGNLGWGGGG